MNQIVNVRDLRLYSTLQRKLCKHLQPYRKHLQMCHECPSTVHECL